MPINKTVQIPKPKQWDEFEILVWDLFRMEWRDPTAVRHGRTGQRQQGVDIYGRPDVSLGLVGLQVKGKNQGFDSQLTKREMELEIENAREFTPALERLVFVTSAPRDAAVQRVARALSEENTRKGLFSVEVLGWDDVEERLASHPDLLKMYYPELFGGSDPGPQLRFIVGLNAMWASELPVGKPGASRKIPFELHCGLLNSGGQVADTALMEFGLIQEVTVEGMPSRTILRAGTRSVYWKLPGGTDIEDDIRWFHFRWTAQALGTGYHPIFSTADPVHAFAMNLSASPDKEGRLLLLPWRVQAHGMRSKQGLVSVGYRLQLITLEELDWPVEIRSVLPS